MDYTQRIGSSLWSKLYQYLKPFSRMHTNNEDKMCRFVEEVFWMLRSGTQWCIPPKEYGDGDVVYQRFSDGADRGVWYKMLSYFAPDPDREYIVVDSTVLRVHACAAGALKKVEGKR